MRTCELKTITEWPQDPLFTDGWHNAFDQDKPCPYKNCYKGFGGIYQVKLFIGGAARILGQTFDRLPAVRFADMALVFFAKYRVRRNRPLEDADLNFSLTTAKRDLAECPAARTMLEQWEAQLLRDGVIAERVIPKDSRSAQQVRRDMAIAFRDYSAAVERAFQITGFYPEAVAAFDLARADYLPKLVRINESIDAVLLRDSTTPNE